MPLDFELSVELRLLGFSYLDGLDLHFLSCLLFPFLSRSIMLEEEDGLPARMKLIKLTRNSFHTELHVPRCSRATFFVFYLLLLVSVE